MRHLRSLVLPTLAGVLYFTSWIGFGVWPLGFLCFVPQVFALENATRKQALLRGWWFGFVAHLGGYTWIVHLLRTFAFFPWPVAFFGYLIVCATQGFLFAVFSVVLVASRSASRRPFAALLPLCLVATEFVYPLLFQSYTGVALMPVVQLVQVAELGGVLLLSAVQAVVNGAICDALLSRRSWRSLVPLAVAAAILGADFAYGAVRVQRIEDRELDAPQLRVGLAQPNVGEIQLHQNPYASVLTLWSQTAELHGRGAELVIWPEVGFNLHPVRDGQNGREISNGIPVWLIAGVERSSADRKERWNSAIVVSPEGRIGDHFDKIALLAFGEYIPFGDWFPFLYEWSPLASHLTRGTSTAPLHAAGYKFATFICYEDILPGIVRDIMRSPEGPANALVNLTNDSWYGAGHEQVQHLMLAAVRTIEHRRWMLRATSTGISAFVDAAGRVVQNIQKDVFGVSVRDVPMLSGTTLYEKLGDWPGWLSLAILAAMALRTFTRRRRATSG